MTSKNISEERSPVGLVVCGPCACGKSEVASALSQHYRVAFVDADSYHSDANIKKMSEGVPLSDEDRFPWLITVRKQMILQKKTLHEEREGDSPVAVVAACSALTEKYRKILRGEDEVGSCTVEDTPSDTNNHEEKIAVVFVFLNCSEKVLQSRVDSRQGHFMKGNMLASQLALLEIPHGEVVQGHAVILNGDAELSDVLKEATEKLHQLFTSPKSQE